MSEFKKDVIIDQDNLADSFCNQASIFADYAMLFAQAEEREKRAKLKVEEVEADALLQVKADFDKQGTKVTNGILEATVTLRPEVKKAKREYVKAQGNKVQIKLMLEALTQKKDMLIQLGAAQRAEMNNFIG
jgi:uncharacterized protein YndB with AHSA1/START domain